MKDAELLRAAITAAGSTRKLAPLIVRTPRTVFAWKARGTDLTLSLAVRVKLRQLAKVGT